VYGGDDMMTSIASTWFRQNLICPSHAADL
jgi:hypothetical protein